MKVSTCTEKVNIKNTFANFLLQFKKKAFDEEQLDDETD